MQWSYLRTVISCTAACYAPRLSISRRCRLKWMLTEDVQSQARANARVIAGRRYRIRP